MKERSEFLSTLTVILSIAFMLGLAFLFEGEPSVWDKLRADAMGDSCKEHEEVK